MSARVPDKIGGYGQPQVLYFAACFAVDAQGRLSSDWLRGYVPRC
jgi:hypothetical protein